MANDEDKDLEDEDDDQDAELEDDEDDDAKQDGDAEEEGEGGPGGDDDGDDAALEDEEEDDDDEELAAGTVECPYCGEPGEVAADFDADEPGEQVFVQDCEVCCRPWTVTVRVGHDGQVRYDVGRG